MKCCLPPAKRNKKSFKWVKPFSEIYFTFSAFLSISISTEIIWINTLDTDIRIFSTSKKIPFNQSIVCVHFFHHLFMPILLIPRIRTLFLIQIVFASAFKSVGLDLWYRVWADFITLRLLWMWIPSKWYVHVS